MSSEIKSIWERRALIWIFAVNDLKLRYRNSVLGFFWSVAEPLLMLTVLYLVFTNIFETDIKNYELYLLSGLVLWFFLNRATNMSLTSILGRANIITKINFPKEILPISSCLTSFFMLIFELGVFFLFMIPAQFIPTFTIVWLPLILVIEFILVLGISFPLSIINVRFRDIQYLWVVVIQAGFFLMPIIYELKIFPQVMQDLLSYIPMVGILVMARDVILYNTHPTFEGLSYLILSSLAVLVIGYGIFKKLEPRIVEEL